MDIAILGVTGLSALLGLWRGLIKTILPILGLFLGLTLGGKYGRSVSHLVFDSPSGWQNFLGFIIVVMAALVLAAIIAGLLRKLLSFLMLGWVDRIAGLIGGALLALLFWSFILVIASSIPGLKEFIADSAIASFILKHLSSGATTGQAF